MKMKIFYSSEDLLLLLQNFLLPKSTECVVLEKKSILIPWKVIGNFQGEEAD